MPNVFIANSNVFFNPTKKNIEWRYHFWIFIYFGEVERNRLLII